VIPKDPASLVFLDLLARAEDAAALAVDREGRITACTRGFLRLAELGEEPLGHPLAEFLLDEAEAPRPTWPGPGEFRPLRLTLASRNGALQTLAGWAAGTEEGVAILATRLMLAHSDVLARMSSLEDERVNLNRELQRKVRELEEARAEVKTLTGLLPICANCKKIRDDRGYWQHVEQYIQAHSSAQFTHGICGDCIRELYPGLHPKSTD
jgi:PAS domain-containing protein